MNGNPIDDPNRAAQQGPMPGQPTGQGAAPVAAPAVQPWPQQPAVAMPARDPRAKSPALACILSAVPGLGQIYVGYYARGFVHAVVVAVLFTLLVGVAPGEGVMPLLLLFMIFFWLYNVIDAGRRAALFNEALAGNRSIEPPEDLKLPGLGGSITGGLLFIAGGAILLSNTAFGASLDWLEDWWPAGAILFGAYLLVKGVLDHIPRKQDSAITSNDDERNQGR